MHVNPVSSFFLVLLVLLTLLPGPSLGSIRQNPPCYRSHAVHLHRHARRKPPARSLRLPVLAESWAMGRQHGTNTPTIVCQRRKCRWILHWRAGVPLDGGRRVQGSPTGHPASVQDNHLPPDPLLHRRLHLRRHTRAFQRP